VDFGGGIAGEGAGSLFKPSGETTGGFAAGLGSLSCPWVLGVGAACTGPGVVCNGGDSGFAGGGSDADVEGEPDR